MNEQFENLLYEAGLTAQGCWDELDDYARQGIKTLFELTVKECLNVVGNPICPNYAYQSIQTHFGIKQ